MTKVIDASGSSKYKCYANDNVFYFFEPTNDNVFNHMESEFKRIESERYIK
jgi:hypothetical protein